MLRTVQKPIHLSSSIDQEAYLLLETVGDIVPAEDIPADAWDALEETIAETKHKVLSGKLSPIAFFMQKNLMNIHVVAKRLNAWEWSVRRHMRPTIFKTLSDRMLQRYAEMFKVQVEDLREFRG